MTVEQNGEGEKAAVGTAGRIEHWTQKLLDFSARNRLLNIPQKSRQVVHQLYELRVHSRLLSLIA